MIQSPWRFFPFFITAGLGLVVVVNAGMVFAALHSFPGQAGEEDFALSNHYDAVLEHAEHEAALGWTLAASTDDTGRPVLTLSGRDGVPLHGASVAALARRPLGPPETRQLGFHEVASGRYVADSVLPIPGQWELTVTTSAGGSNMAATRRVIVH